MTFEWIEPLDVGLSITKKFLSEAQNNIDSVNDSLSCGAYDSSIFTINDSSDNGSDDGSVYSSKNSTIYGGYDGGYDGTDQSSNWGHCPGVNGSYDSPDFTTCCFGG
jgi:hypothetical protein